MSFLICTEAVTRVNCLAGVCGRYLIYMIVASLKYFCVSGISCQVIADGVSHLKI